LRGVYALFLKSLELQGFKSFPDRTVLTFDRGITAIVGPNGSGKSNIADAIRWALGEQSTKALRGAKMEDVIFGGTQTRGPVGYAEVSLILDNDSGMLPVESSEVMVTRRYYRSGESEFYINKSSVRLKDIHELFMDTGLGRDGYSIIGQGHIDEILSVRSTDRREIFEEAAGISKFRYRKEEAERKLAGTEENLVRINDKISELELNVEPLREQAEKAKQYLRLRDELRELEVSVWLESLGKVKKESEETIRDYDIVNRQLDHEKAELEKLYRQSEELSETMHQKDSEIEAGRRELELLEEELSRIESDIAVLKATKENIRDNIKRLEEEMEEQSGRTESLDEQIAEELDGINRELAELDEECARLSDSAAGLSERVDALYAMESGEEAEINRLRMELRSLESASSELMSRRSNLRNDLEEKLGALDKLRSDMSAAGKKYEEEKEKAASLENVISGYEMRLARRRQKYEASSEEYTKLRMEQNALENRIKLLEDMARDYEGYSNAVKLVIRESRRGNLKGIRGPLSMLIKVRDEHVLAIETALGSGLQNIVTEDEQHAKAAIEMLKRMDGGRATFLPMSAIRGRSLEKKPAGERGFIGIASELVKSDPAYSEIISYSLGRTVVAADLNSAIEIAKKHGYRFRIVTLDGQVINAGGSMTGGSSGRNTGILSRSNELERLGREAAGLSEKLRSAEAELKDLKRELTAAEYELEVAEGEKRKADDAVLKLEGDLAAIRDKLETGRQLTDGIRRELDETERRLSENEGLALSIGREIEGHERRRDEIHEEIEAIREGRSEMELRHGELSEKAAKLRESRSGRMSERQTLLKNLQELRELKEQFSLDRERRREFISGYMERIDAIEADISKKREDAENTGRKRMSAREKISGLTASKLGLEAERTSADRKAKEKNESILRLQQEKGRLEQKKNEAEIYEKQIVDKLWDTYGLTLSAAASVAVPLSSMTSANRRISSLKREMAGLGEVNIGAIDEYRRVSERYEYLRSQRDDVEKAKGELEAIISEITVQMKEIFGKQFIKINENFAQTFVEIFGGGRAQLELEDTDDILNCGIEIRVQPPGKSLKTISLLSGGEKAFAAIALYFAIIKVRPTPFCVLDEIEAALDEKNVVRFAKYLRKLSKNTQFILITHRRGTMEECDILYGVTMQSTGISRILALNINDAERELGLKIHNNTADEQNGSN
jgi:chromosome segregation protein